MLIIASIVTAAMVEEYLIFRRSMELFHSERLAWCIRCDEASAKRLEHVRFASCRVFSRSINVAAQPDSALYREIMNEKILSVEDAWACGAESVLYCDVDMIVASEFLSDIMSGDAELALSPNYYPSESTHLNDIHGIFNGGLVLSRTPRFVAWWRKEAALYKSSFADQLCLNSASRSFSCRHLPSEYNVGFWRSVTPTWRGGFIPIPINCRLLHVHLFQPYSPIKGWIDRAFALHCLRFLRSGDNLKRNAICDIILSGRFGHYYNHLSDMTNLCFGPLMDDKGLDLQANFVMDAAKEQ